LRLSGEHELLHKTLLFAALLQDPTFHLFETQDPFTILSHLLQQKNPLPLMIQNDLEPPTEGLKPLPASWTILPAGWTAQQASKMWYAVKEALRKKNLKRAVYLSCVIKEPVVMESFLKSLDVSKNYLGLLRTWGTNMLQRTTLHSLASLISTFNVAPKNTYNIPLPTRIDGRKGRTFAISGTALACWGLKSKPVTRLQGEPTLIFDDDACEYWIQLRNQHGNPDSFYKASDEFHSAAFPDDIPDEWSTEERSKSHNVPQSDGVKCDWTLSFKLLWL
jgi:hypothetical protein